MNITAGDLVYALRNGGDTPYELNLRVAHRALVREGLFDIDYETWLDTMTPAEMRTMRERVEAALDEDGDTDPTGPSSL